MLDQRVEEALVGLFAFPLGQVFGTAPECGVPVVEMDVVDVGDDGGEVAVHCGDAADGGFPSVLVQLVLDEIELGEGQRLVADGVGHGERSCGVGGDYWRRISDRLGRGIGGVWMASSRASPLLQGIAWPM
ncbi:hypothetical protein D9M73_159100 [compost metagenome]